MKSFGFSGEGVKRVWLGIVGAVMSKPCAEALSDFRGLFVLLEVDDERSNFDLSDPGLSDTAECGEDGLCRSCGGVWGFGIDKGVYPCGIELSMAAAALG